MTFCHFDKKIGVLKMKNEAKVWSKTLRWSKVAELKKEEKKVGLMWSQLSFIISHCRVPGVSKLCILLIYGTEDKPILRKDVHF